ncbi:hypothetical protein SUGI_1178650 [Cryptomeria japonica]|nr:hypothetical protein SUGI_1178650 [Cryptomeria japonica]
MVVVAVVLYIMSAESDFAIPLLVLFVIHSVLFIYVRSFRESIILELTTLIVAIVVKIVAQLAKIIVKMVRPRSSSSYVDGASAWTGPVEQPPPSSSSYSVDDELRGPLEQPLEMGVFSYRCHGEEQQGECVICLCEYQEEDSLMALPLCQHCFHVECIRRWFKCQLRCPICNASPFQELGSHAGKDVALQIPLPPLLVAGNMREGNLVSEHNV